MGCYNQYKAIGCSYTYTECKSKHMLHTLALWGLVTITGRGGGGYKNKIVRSAANLLLAVQNVCIHFLRIDNSRRVRFHILYIEYLKSVLEF